MLIEDPSSPTQAMIMTQMNSTSGSNISSLSVKRIKQKDPAKNPMIDTQADWSKID